MRLTERLDGRLIEQCFRDANAARWDVTREAFASTLTASAAKAFADTRPSDRQLQKYLQSLHLEDLALACACAAGHEAAWDHFLVQFRPLLYRTADATSDPACGREVADSLYGELFGVKSRDGQRRSLFHYFHGRSSLATWLRAVFAQRYVDAVRQRKRLEPLPDDDSAEALACASEATFTGRDWRGHAALQRAFREALHALDARDRLRLRCYYAQALTLAAIGRLLGEHEATVSRHLTSTRRLVRERVEAFLREHEGMSPAQIDECLSSASKDPGPLDIADLLGAVSPEAEPGRKKVAADRSK